jgi:signal transduction histidine kinase
MGASLGFVAIKWLSLLPGGVSFTALSIELSATYFVMAALLIVVGEISNKSRRRAERVEADLKEVNDELEQRVEDRTAALANSLQTLEGEIDVRRRAEKLLSELSAHLIRLQDEERRRIARDLHDSTGQTLAAIKLTIDALERVVGSNAKTGDIFHELKMLTDQALQEIRATSHLLHPPLLDEVGFSSAARWYVDEFAKRTGIKVTLALKDAPELPKPCELVFFRVLQESLTNVLRHSGSNTVDITMNCEGKNAVLSVRDHGKGIPPEKLNAFRETGAGVGVGLGGMKQRVRELCGELHIDSNPSGTSVKASLPVGLQAQGTSAAD